MMPEVTKAYVKRGSELQPISGAGVEGEPVSFAPFTGRRPVRTLLPVDNVFTIDLSEESLSFGNIFRFSTGNTPKTIAIVNHLTSGQGSFPPEMIEFEVHVIQSNPPVAITWPNSVDWLDNEPLYVAYKTHIFVIRNHYTNYFVANLAYVYED